MPDVCSPPLFFRLFPYMRLWIFIIVLGFASAASAQSGGSVQGQVMDQTGAVIPNASVVLSPSSGRSVSATSDGLGRFQFQSVSPGSYSIHISAQNFSPFNSRITVPAARDRPRHVPAGSHAPRYARS